MMPALVLVTWALMAEPDTIEAFGLPPAWQAAVVAKHKAVFTAPPQKIPRTSTGKTYYVDALAGGDSADGGATGPWRSLGRVNQQVFAPGDAVLFKAGCHWQGQLRPKGSGSEGHPIRIDRYGEGPLPVIDMGAATGAAVRLSNQEYWEIRHLEITSGGAPGWGSPSGHSRAWIRRRPRIPPHGRRRLPYP